MSAAKHDVQARECIVITSPPLPPDLLHDDSCPACQEISALIDLDPDYGSAEDGRPYIGSNRA